MSPAGADVAIIGGGIVGTALAAELAGRGARVTLFERAGIASGASGRNSGVVWYPSDPVLGELYRESLARYRALVGEIGAELPGDAPEQAFRLDDRPAGILTLGEDEAALRVQAAAIETANPDFRAQFVDRDALAELEPGLADGLAAVRLDIGYPVAPAAATHAFAALAVARGADVRPGEDAAIERYGGIAAGVRSLGRVTPAGSVVVAAGPWTPSVVDPSGTWRPILPYWGVIVELELASPPKHVLEEADITAVIEPDGGLADEADGSSGFSLVSAAGRSSLGSTFLPFEPEPRDYESRLRASGARYLPAIAGTPTSGLRACARPLARDGRPLVGAVPGVDGLYVAAGHGPWGISTGPASAMHVAALVLGDADPRTPAVAAATSASRFGAPPG